MLVAANKQLKPSGCGCGTSAATPSPPVYVVGSLGFDFGTEARRDALFAANGGVPITTGAQLSQFLTGRLFEAASIIFTLSDDQYPIYAVRPLDPFGADAYAALQGFLLADRLSVPGWVKGSVRLLNGWVVPVIQPDIQGLRSWSTQSVVTQIATSGGSLTVSNPMAVAVPAEVSLTMLGTLDWTYWGSAFPADFEHSAQSNSEISNFTANAALTQSSTPGYVLTWSNGTPNTSSPLGGATNASTITAANGSFSFTAPADETTRVLTVYVNATGTAVGTLVATLSDGSAPPVSVSTSGAGPFTFTVAYQATKAAKLAVTWTLSSGAGSIVLQAATLVLPPLTTEPVNTNQADLTTFMNRIYFELRNKGMSPQERATNFAATQAYFVNNVITYAVGHGLNLQNIAVSHSPLCRPGSECWDVTLTFFDPQNVTAAAHKVFRFTVDVSDVKPVMIGPMYKWNSY